MLTPPKRPRERLGLGKGEVRVVPYDPGWVTAFRELRARLRRILPRARIEHVGSTAIAGMEAKPIIDVSVGLAPGSRLNVDAARSIRLEFRSVSPESAHFVFRDKAGRHVAHVHVNPLNSEAELSLLRCRDYLRAHPAAVQEYAAAKHRALALSRNRGQYTEAKAPFIRALGPRIRRWVKRTAWAPD